MPVARPISPHEPKGPFEAGFRYLHQPYELEVGVAAILT